MSLIFAVEEFESFILRSGNTVNQRYNTSVYTCLAWGVRGGQEECCTSFWCLFMYPQVSLSQVGYWWFIRMGSPTVTALFVPVSGADRGYYFHPVCSNSAPRRSQRCLLSMETIIKTKTKKTCYSPAHSLLLEHKMRTPKKQKRELVRRTGKQMPYFDISNRCQW